MYVDEATDETFDAQAAATCDGRALPPTGSQKVPTAAAATAHERGCGRLEDESKEKAHNWTKTEIVRGRAGSCPPIAGQAGGRFNVATPGVEFIATRNLSTFEGLPALKAAQIVQQKTASMQQPKHLRHSLRFRSTGVRVAQVCEML